jgi:mannose/fructose/N-acetylgalactosamine-specific phosphotransferase system component IID
MYLIAIAWIYVVLMMAVAEAISPQGTVLGAFFTLLLYGALPVALLMYILATPHRRRARQAIEAAEEAAARASAQPPDGGGEAAGAAVAPVGEKP